MLRRNFLCGAGAALVPLRAFAAPVRQSRARALIIANSYFNDLYLANTLSDGRLIEARLQALNFLSVVRVEDADDPSLRSAIGKFRASLAPKDLAFVYIAGHGVQIGDENFLLLGDGQTFLSIVSIVESVRQATSSLILMLDACRNKPFDELPDGIRLARAVAKKSTRDAEALELKVASPQPKAPVGTIKAFQLRGTGVKVVFATDPQNVAYDAVDTSQRNSPFALAIAKRLAERKSLDDVVAFATGDVVRATSGNQSPWSQGSIGEPIFLAGPPENKNPARPPFQVPG